VLRWRSNVGFYELPDSPGAATVRVSSGATEVSADLGGDSLDVSTLAGLTVTVTVSFAGSWSGDASGPNFVDDIRFEDGAAEPLGGIINGTFDTDLTGWTIAPQAELQNVTTAAQTLAGLDVTRSFFTIPNRIWARSVDTFTNNTAEAITATVTYLSDIGSDGAGAVFNLDNEAVSAWDMSQSDPDIGFLFGNTATLTSYSASGTRNDEGAFDFTRAVSDSELGNDEVQATYTITVEPGATVSLAVFTIMSPVLTGATAADNTVHPTLVESTIATIQADLRSDGQYFTGMTQAQIDSLANF
jgi:hypothetical protein